MSQWNDIRPRTMPGRVPLFSLSRHAPFHTDPKALQAFYDNRPMMWRNVIFIGIANLGWGLALGIIGPLMITTLLRLGVKENIQGTITAINGWAITFLVMLFSWMSDHTVSRVGRRKLYFFVSAPFIIATIVLFPFFALRPFVWFLIAMQVVYLLFMDVKQSTFSLIMIDCVPRWLLGQTNSIFGIVGGITGFLADWYAGWLIHLGEAVPFIVGGVVMVLTTLCAFLVKEPPVYHPPTEPFKPWSTFKVAARDKRVFVLMAGVAMIGAYGYSSMLWMWFWTTASLGLSRSDIFRVISVAPLANIVLAYPIGWVIDHVGGLKVVLVYWTLSFGCFLLQMRVQDKTELVMLILAQTVAFPLYAAADIMVYKSSPEQDVGSITSTNACFRNGFGGAFAMASGWLIYWMNHDYRAGFVMGQIFSTIGLVFFLIHAWLMRNGPGPSQIEVDPAESLMGRHSTDENSNNILKVIEK